MSLNPRLYTDADNDDGASDFGFGQLGRSLPVEVKTMSLKEACRDGGTSAVLNCPPIVPSREMAAYEALWTRSKTSFKSLADYFRSNPKCTPSGLVSDEEIRSSLSRVLAKLSQAKISDFGIRLHGTADYPECLRDAAHPVELLYYRGWWDLVDSPKRIAVVGSRNASEEGERRTRRLVRLLVDAGYTIVSGLAKGVDTVVHKTAIARGGNTIAVIGTPITESYPSENRDLQDEIAENHLLISQVPICRYAEQDYRSNRQFFPERNVTMSAISQATVIVEASETSGTLAQARAALRQGRKLFILDSCFQKPDLTWPQHFEAQGAIRVTSVDDILETLE